MRAWGWGCSSPAGHSACIRGRNDSGAWPIQPNGVPNAGPRPRRPHRIIGVFDRGLTSSPAPPPSYGDARHQHGFYPKPARSSSSPATLFSVSLTGCGDGDQCVRVFKQQAIYAFKKSRRRRGSHLESYRRRRGLFSRFLQGTVILHELGHAWAWIISTLRGAGAELGGLGPFVHLHRSGTLRHHPPAGGPITI